MPVFFEHAYLFINLSHKLQLVVLSHHLFRREYIIIGLQMKYEEGVGKVQSPIHIEFYSLDMVQYSDNEASGIRCNWCHFD